MTMMRERRVMQILCEAVARDAAEREAWLDAACAGDAELRSDVARLLDHEKTAPDFMKESPFDEAARSYWEGESFIGRQIGHYEIIEEIGRGGMGAVYLARRADAQYESRVALKIIKRGMDTDFILRRFRNERQILASLNHPYIAKLLDGGTTEDGQPYFVMELIEGKPLRKFCDDEKLSVEDRLILFRRICAAVSYAHRNLIVHRDLKPSNILVTSDGTPKLLDFGIAKILSPNAAEETHTNVRAMTPEYASPEQLCGDLITTASDIYSLGVILYELLTGRRPYSLEHCSEAEAARIISEHEPEKPSTAITNRRTGGAENNEKAPERVSLARRCTPAELSRRLRGDLDTITLMAMRREPARRYASVEQFSEDIERHLAGLPVRARKDTFNYRASKFVQRNKVGVAASALVLLTLTGGVVATLWQAHTARVERARAEQRFNQVRNLAHSVLFDYHDEIAPLPGSTRIRARLVKDALQYLDNLAQEAGGDASLQREIATAYLKASDIQGGVYQANLGDTKGALQSSLKAAAILERLVDSEPSNTENRVELSSAFEKTGRLQSAAGRSSDALDSELKALKIREALAASKPNNADYRRLLADSYLYLGDVLGFVVNENGVKGRFAEALDKYRKALAIREELTAADSSNTDDRYQTAVLYQRIGSCLTSISDQQGDRNNYPAAIENLRRSLAICESLSASDPTNARYRRAIADRHGAIGSWLFVLGKPDEGLDNINQAISAFEALSAADPNDSNARWDLAYVDNAKAGVLSKRGDISGALEINRKGAEIIESLIVADPGRINESYSYLSVSYKLRGELLEKKGDPAGASASYRKEFEIDERLKDLGQTDVWLLTDMASASSRLGRIEMSQALKSQAVSAKQLEHWREAKAWYQKSLDIYQQMKIKGTLAVADAGKPNEIANEIAKCDAALSK